MLQIDFDKNTISEFQGNFYWSSNGDRKARRDEIINKSPIALTVNSIEYNLNGKPYLSTGTVFNISHSLNYSILVVSNTFSSIGIDIEVNRPIKYRERIANKFFLKSEQDYCSVPNGLERFWEIWVKKEAIAKYFGGSIIEDALKINTLEFGSLFNNNDVKMLYDIITDGKVLIHISEVYL